MNRIVILGATSGIGLEIAKLYIAAGWQVGAAAVSYTHLTLPTTSRV